MKISDHIGWASQAMSPSQAFDSAERTKEQKTVGDLYIQDRAALLEAVVWRKNVDYSGAVCFARASGTHRAN